MHRPIVTGQRLESEYGITYSRVHRDRLTKAGKFPRKIRLGGRSGSIAYYRHEIEAWIESRPVVGPQSEADGKEAAA
jgi:predicted DNA-binding transcriptional regulator AlpA